MAAATCGAGKSSCVYFLGSRQPLGIPFQFSPPLSDNRRRQSSLLLLLLLGRLPPCSTDSGRSRRRRGSWFRQSQAICTAQQKQPEESCDFHSDPVQLPPMMPYHDAIPCHRHATCHTTRVMSNGAQGRRGESQISFPSGARRLIMS